MYRLLILISVLLAGCATTDRVVDKSFPPYPLDAPPPKAGCYEVKVCMYDTLEEVVNACGTGPNTKACAFPAINRINYFNRDWAGYCAHENEHIFNGHWHPGGNAQ